MLINSRLTFWMRFLQVALLTTVASNNAIARELNVPDKPTSFKVRNLSDTSVTLQWETPTLHVERVYYELLRNGRLVAEIQGHSFTDTELSPSTNYHYDLRAVNDRIYQHLQAPFMKMPRMARQTIGISIRKLPGS